VKVQPPPFSNTRMLHNCETNPLLPFFRPAYNVETLVFFPLPSYSHSVRLEYCGSEDPFISFFPPRHCPNPASILFFPPLRLLFWRSAYRFLIEDVFLFPPPFFFCCGWPLPTLFFEFPLFSLSDMSAMTACFFSFFLLRVAFSAFPFKVGE